MFCSKCGVENNDDAKFCKDCGEFIQSTLSHSTQGSEKISNSFSTPKTVKKPRSVLFYIFMPISVFVGTIVAWGTVSIFNDVNNPSLLLDFFNTTLIPLIIGILLVTFPVSVVYGFYVNSRYYDGTIKCGNCGYVGIGKKSRSTWAQIVVWLLFFFFWPITLIYYLVTHRYECPKCTSTFIGLRDKAGLYSGQKSGIGGVMIAILIIVVVAIIGVLAAVVLAALSDAREAAKQAAENQSELILDETTNNLPLNAIKRSVVNIYCESSLDGEIGGGSGTMMTTDGYILTAAHIFPQNEDTVFVDPNQGCLVTIPDIETGATDEMYWADPIIMQGLSDVHDIAFMQITDVVIDEDGVAQGVFPQTFDSFWDSTEYSALCIDDNLNIELGENVRVLGYPTTSGGLSLTITEGIVSAIGDNGRLLTTAKIDSGNSGGIAVADDGCIIGMPIAVQHGDFQNLGEIIPGGQISKFFELVEVRLEE